jgi:hypothetical protein
MKSFEIESWALRTLERLEKRLPVEDSLVELKTMWPDPVRAARRIAGHANAARGEAILWLIGADEKNASVPGANYTELANWFPQVKACFESEVPSLQDLNVTYKGKTVTALCFDTSRFPYLVKNPKLGEILFEVPWREGTAVKTATRGDLILMLSPLIAAPKVKLLEGRMNLGQGPDGRWFFSFDISAYLIPLTAEPVAFPLHNCKAQLLSGGSIVVESFMIEIDTPQMKHERVQQAAQHMQNTIARARKHPTQTPLYLNTTPHTIEITTDELIARGPGKVFLSGSKGFALRYSGQDDLELSIEAVEARSEVRTVIAGNFFRIRDTKSATEPNRWSLST